MRTLISVTQAARTFSALLKRVHDRREECIIARDGEPICLLSPVKPPTCTVADLGALLRSLPKPDPGFWEAVEEATKYDTDLAPSPWER